MEPIKFALSRSRRIVNDTDLVATISLKKQQNNSWLQRHLPLQSAPFRKIVIGPISNRNTAVKDESASAEDKPESSKDRSNSREGDATLLSGQGAVEDMITPVGDRNREVEDQSTISHATPVECC